MEKAIARAWKRISQSFGRPLADSLLRELDEPIQRLSLDSLIQVVNSSEPQVASKVAVLSKARAARAVLCANREEELMDIHNFAARRFSLLDEACSQKNCLGADAGIKTILSAALSRGELLPLLVSVPQRYDGVVEPFCAFHCASQLLIDSYLQAVAGKRCILRCNPNDVCKSAAVEALQIFSSTHVVPSSIDVVVQHPRETENLEIKFPQPLLHYVAVEVIKNALQSTHVRSNGIFDSSIPVRIKLSKVNEHVQIEIRDHGTGVEVHNEKSMWRIGWSTNTRPSLLSGSGLGLPLSKIFLELYGGSIRHWPSESGCTFEISTPVRSSETFPVGSICLQR